MPGVCIGTYLPSSPTRRDTKPAARRQCADTAGLCNGSLQPNWRLTMQRLPSLALLMAATLLPAAAQARTPHVNPDAPTVVLVHGAFADASSWDKVVARLQKRGLPVMTVDNPLTSLADDVAATQRAIAAAPGKVVLVGHSWGGTVITQAGRDPKVSALVYVAAFAPDVGQNAAQQGEGFPVAPGLQKLVESGGFLS